MGHSLGAPQPVGPTVPLGLRPGPQVPGLVDRVSTSHIPQTSLGECIEEMPQGLGVREQLEGYNHLLKLPVEKESKE